MQIESDRPANRSTDTNAAVDSLRSHDAVDGTKDIKIEYHSNQDPLYQEIQLNPDQSSAAVPIYAKVAKKRGSTNVIEQKIVSQLFSSKSYDSLDLLNNTNDMNLVSSIENILEQQFLELKPKNTSEYKSIEDLIQPAEQSVERIETAINERGSIKCEESIQKSHNPDQDSNHNDTHSLVESGEKPNPWSIISAESEATIYSDVEVPKICTTAPIDVHVARDEEVAEQSLDGFSFCSINSSIVRTESICDEVTLGQNINDEIFNTMSRLESFLNITDGANYAQAYPESDGFDDDDEPTREVKQHDSKMPHELFSSVYKQPSLHSPKYKQLANTLRNSFRRGSRFFSTNSVDRKSEDPSKADEQLSTRAEISLEVPTMSSYMQLLRSQTVLQLELRPQLHRAIEVCRNISGNLTVLKCYSKKN